MTRLLMVTTIERTLGAFLIPYAQHFRSQGWRVDGMARDISLSSGYWEVFDRTWDVSWSRRPRNVLSWLRAANQVRAVVRRGMYDLVHVHTPIAAFVTRYALRDLRRNGRPKVIYTAHGFHFHKGASMARNALFLTLEKLAAPHTDYLVVLNREDEESAIRHRILPKQRIRYMPGIGVDAKALDPARVRDSEVQQVRGELGLKEHHRLFLMIAEFNAGKRHRDALSAFRLIDDPEVHLAFAGVGPLMADMQAMARKLNLIERVHFLGFRSDIPALIKASVATVLPSEREGLPRSVMESLCLGVPAIGADTRGTRDLLVNGCGLLVPVGDVQRLAAAMQWVLRHPKEVQNMGRSGRSQMAIYDIRRVLTEHEALYAEALGQNGVMRCYR